MYLFHKHELELARSNQDYLAKIRPLSRIGCDLWFERCCDILHLIIIVQSADKILTGTMFTTKL